MNDTLAVFLEAIQKNQIQSIDLVQKVDDFYNNAWTKLIIVISVGFTVVGIIVPLFIQWFQKRSLQASENLLKKEISDNAKKIKEELLAELITKIDDKYKVYEKEIKVTRASANAKLFSCRR